MHRGAPNSGSRSTPLTCAAKRRGRRPASDRPSRRSIRSPGRPDVSHGGGSGGGRGRAPRTRRAEWRTRRGRASGLLGTRVVAGVLLGGSHAGLYAASHARVNANRAMIPSTPAQNAQNRLTLRARLATIGRCEPPSARTASCRCSEHVAAPPSRTWPARSVSRHRRSGATSSDCPTAGRVVRTYGGAAIPGPRLADIIDPAAPGEGAHRRAGRGAGQGWLDDRRRERLDDAGVRPAPRRPRGPDGHHERPRRGLDAGRPAGHRPHRPRRCRSGRGCTACSAT